MTDTSPDAFAALDALIQAVEAGEASWNRLASIAEDAMPPKEAALAATANRGSLDAARALHDAALPGWVKWNMQHSYFGYECDLTNGDCDASGVSKDNPARAWLLAILRALKSQVRHD